MAAGRFSANPDLAAAILRWIGWLEGEKRASPHTIAAYGGDLARFLDFLTEHRGSVPDLALLTELTPADFRAFLARRAADGIERSSYARGLSVLRNFFRFLDRRGIAKNPALAAVRSPKLPKPVPKALSAEEAQSALDGVAGMEREVWIAKRDLAILILLYGAGLRIGEALSLKRAEAPPAAGALIVTGKGNKQRMVPILPAVADALPRSLPACARPRRPAVRGITRRAPASAHRAGPDGEAARGVGPAGPCHAACAAAQLRDASAGGRRRSARDPGTVGPRQSFDHAALYQDRRDAASGGLRSVPSARESMMDGPPRLTCFTCSCRKSAGNR
jgi:site-specific recombinase XerC